MPTSHSEITRREFVAPEENGQQLIWPMESLAEIWNQNLQIVERNRQRSFGSKPLSVLMVEARQSMLKLALSHVAFYAPEEPGIEHPDDLNRILMAGHQPELFHSGVWFKNFVLNKWGARFSAIPINLIIDNDLSDRPSIQVPESAQETSNLVEVFFDQPAGVKPFEETWVSDSNQFNQFGERVRETIGADVPHALIEPLWSETRIAHERLTIASQDGKVNLGEVIAAGRHRLEMKFGLRTLEVPLSKLADEKPFSEFAWIILSRAHEFLELHNRGIVEYRAVYGLRSKSHPFPQLETRELWIEVPFWIWSQAKPERNRLFVQPLDRNGMSGSMQLTDFDGFYWELDGSNPIAGLVALRAEGYKLRPRALTTTMFSRLLLSDLFIHGIGGGKYDSLTDWIAERFFDLRLPDYCVTSATYKLPLQQRAATESDLVHVQQQLRQLETHPEKVLLDSSSKVPLSTEVKSAIDRKRELILGHFSGSGRERHQAIAECNQRLRQALAPLQKELTDRLAIIEQDLAANQILGSREFSFCLFATDLIERLQNC